VNAENTTIRKRLTIILHSGSYDKVTNALSLAIVSLTMDMEVYVLLTYEALRRFIKGHLEDPDATEPDLLAMMKKGIDSGKFHSISEKLATAEEMGLKLYACNTAMATLDIVRENLVDEVDDIMGLTAFTELAQNASINWYI
jgi:peroxiredoxin family protein